MFSRNREALSQIVVCETAGRVVQPADRAREIHDRARTTAMGRAAGLIG